MFDIQIKDIKSFKIEIKGFELLENWPIVRLLLVTNRFFSNEMKRFLLHFKNIKKSVITECKAFLDKILRLYSD